MSTTSVLTRVWPALALLAAAAMLAAAHAFQNFGGLAPCPLCLRQREVYWAVIAAAGAGLVLLRFKPLPLGLPALCAVLGALFLGGAGVAGYHVGVEQGWIPVPASCAGGNAADIFKSGKSLAEMLDGAKTVTACNEVPWSLFGLSMAAYNMAISLALAGVSFVAAFAQPRGA